MIDWLIYIPIFVLGSIVGSFLNVVILRYNTGLSFAKGRSRCFSCGHELGPIDLVPILSFIFNRGRCRYCGSKISWQYPIVELLTAILFVLTINRFGTLFIFENIWSVILSLIIVSILVIITVYDIRHKIIPDGLLIGLSIIALIFSGVEFWPDWTSLIYHLVGGALISTPLFAISLLSRGRYMGLGDPKLVVVLGLILGPVLGLSALVFAFWLGALYGLVLIALSRLHIWGIHIDRKSELPFAPFLILGFFLAFLWEINLFIILGI